MNKRRVGIDFDDTVADSIPYVVRNLNKEYLRDYSVDEFTQWDYHNALGLPKVSFWTDYHKWMDKADVNDILPTPGAREIIPFLARSNELYILTARQHKFKPYIDAWTHYHFPDCFSGVITCGGQEKGRKKHELMKERGLVVLVDDSYDDVVSARLIGRAGVLFSALHNLSYNYSPRADSWKDVNKLLTR